MQWLRRTRKVKTMQNEAFELAKQELDQAWQNFELADQDHVDIAAHQIKAAELKLSEIVKSLKGGEAV